MSVDTINPARIASADHSGSTSPRACSAIAKGVRCHIHNPNSIPNTLRVAKSAEQHPIQPAQQWQRVTHKHTSQRQHNNEQAQTEQTGTNKSQ